MKLNNVKSLYDFLIVGSGIIGTNVARELSKYQVSILVVEKESDIVNGASIANSGIIHSGHDPLAETLKAKLCVEGNKLTHELSKELGFHLLKCGGIVLAFSEEEKLDLLKLYENAVTNKVPNVKLLGKKEVLRREPKVNNNVLLALDVSTTSVCSPWEMAIASMENAVLNGAKYLTNSEVTNIKYINEVYEVEINHKDIIKAKNVINAAGLNTEKIGLMLEESLDYHILPRKGEYFTLDPKNKGDFTCVLYPMPSKVGKGVLIVPQVHGETLIGPTGEDVKDNDNRVTASGLGLIVTEAIKISKHIQFYDNIRNFAGVRAKSSYDDFYIKESSKYLGFYHLAGIDSPGLTAAPAIAKYLVDMIKAKNILVKKDNYIKGRSYTPLFRYLSEEEKLEAIKADPKHGHIICKCENITEQDVINALNGVIPVDTVKALKKRTRAGAGICQGGYCERHVLQLISEYKNKKMTEVDYYEENTPILLEDIKEPK